MVEIICVNDSWGWGGEQACRLPWSADTSAALLLSRVEEAVFVKHLQRHASRFSLLRVTPTLLKAALTFRHGSSGHGERWSVLLLLKSVHYISTSFCHG